MQRAAASLGTAKAVEAACGVCTDIVANAKAAGSAYAVVEATVRSVDTLLAAALSGVGASRARASA